MRRSALISVFALVSLVMVSCGGDGGDRRDRPAPSSGSGGAGAATWEGTAADNRPDPAAGRRGGVITVLSVGDVDDLDPGRAYYGYTIGLLEAVQRGLYTYTPGDPTRPRPDLAESAPQISADGRTVRVRIREGVRFSSPVDREVTSADVKYAIERAFTANVTGPYVYTYFGALVGAPTRPGPYRPVRGIETPNAHALVFRLTEGTGAALAGALTLPISIPVPQEYARRFDAKSPSVYGTHQVFTGPYKIESDETGTLTGYEPGGNVAIVRNPDYVRAGDFRPAFADGFDVRGGNDATAIAARRILSGHGMISGDLTPPPNILKTVLRENRSQISAVPGGGWAEVTMDTSRPPFDDLNVRKAVIAGMDRTALRKLFGGATVGPIAQHYLPPGTPGFEESGGEQGFRDLEWLRNPSGDARLAARYFRAAGYPDGRYGGDETVFMVGVVSSPEAEVAQSVEAQLRRLGFKTRLRLLRPEAVFLNFCAVRDSEVHVCPNAGWSRDFPDPQTLLDPTFSGDRITATRNTNVSELDDSGLNTMIARARLVTRPAERARAWARVNHTVLSLAPTVPYMWAYHPALASADVRGVQNPTTGIWDLSFTSLR
jgi:peptide/nickel transport system substrate-binding protein